MRMSSRTTSGLSFWACCRASLPLSASPTISISVPASKLASPVRMTWWSSQTNILMLMGVSKNLLLHETNGRHSTQS